MSDLPKGVDPDILEDLHTALSGIGLCHVLERPTEVWEMLSLVRSERSMVRGEIYRFTGLGEGYRAGGISRTILKMLDDIRARMGPLVQGLHALYPRISSVPDDPETVEFVTAFVTISPRGQQAAAQWVSAPDASVDDASQKLGVLLKMAEAYNTALRGWKLAPPPPSSPLDKENRPQMVPRFQRLEKPLEGPLIPTAAPSQAEAPPEPPPPAPPVPPEKPPEPEPPPPTPPAAEPETSSKESDSSTVLPRGVDLEILDDLRRVEKCGQIFEEAGKKTEVWEVFMMVMADGKAIKEAMDSLANLKAKDDKAGFQEGVDRLFEQVQKLRAEHGTMVRDLRQFVSALPIGSFGKETMELVVGFIIASPRGLARAREWLKDPGRYRMEAAGRLEDVVSRTMNYELALRMI